MENRLKIQINLAIGALILFLSPGLIMAQDPNLSIMVSPNKKAKTSLFGYKQTIHIQGQALRNVGSLGGQVIITGTVLGNVNVMGGDVAISHGGRVLGNIVCIGGSVQLGGDHQVGGNITNLFPPDGTSQPPWLASHYTRISFYFAHSMWLFLLVSLVFYAFPNQTNEAGFELSQDPVRSAIIGATAWASFVLLLFVCFLLMVVGIGFPLFLVTIAALMALTFFGTVVVFYQLAHTLEFRSGHKITLSWGILLFVLMASMLFYVPMLGGLMAFCIAIFGVGVTIDTRFGTNKQWLTRKARYWGA